MSILNGVVGIETVSAVSGSGELNGLAASANPDVILADDDATDRAALLSVAAELGLPVVLLTSDRQSVRQLSSAHVPAWACLLKEAEAAEITAAVFAAAAGLITLDGSMVPLLTAANVRSVQTIYGELPDPMSPREMEVLQLLAQGLPNKVIANRLNISQHTVKFHVAGILSKLNVGSRTEAVTIGARRGLITI